MNLLILNNGEKTPIGILGDTMDLSVMKNKKEHQIDYIQTKKTFAYFSCRHSSQELILKDIQVAEIVHS